MGDRRGCAAERSSSGSCLEREDDLKGEKWEPKKRWRAPFLERGRI